MPAPLLPAALGALAVTVACADPVAPPATEGPEPALARAAATEAGRPIPDAYIVVFRDDVRDPPGLARGLAAAHGAAVRHEYGHALKGFAARMSGPAAAAIARHPDVAYVEQDQTVSLSTVQSGATWGLDRIDQRDLPLSTTYQYDVTGAGVTAYIIDTGILTGHTQFGGRATSGYDAVDGGAADDCNGHGTHVAGTVGGSTYGVAKDVALVAVRVLDCQGNGTWSGVIAGMDWVVGNHGAGDAVANMSLGGGASSAVDDAVQRIVADGISIAVAAGNGNILGQPQNACNYSPARAPNAITVGSTTSSDARSSWSNYGTCLDLFAPGSGITSAWHTSTTATNTISGTSMATPHVAGAAALYLDANPGAAPSTVRNAIVAAATPNKVTNALSGSPNLLLYSLFGGGSEPPPAENQPPTASFTTSCSGLSCTFTSTSSDADGSVTGWSWDFGNNTSGSGAGPHTVTYAQGQYTVTLTVTDDDGATATASRSLNCRKRGKNVSCQ